MEAVISLLPFAQFPMRLRLCHIGIGTWQRRFAVTLDGLASFFF